MTSLDPVKFGHKLFLTQNCIFGVQKLLFYMENGFCAIYYQKAEDLLCFGSSIKKKFLGGSTSDKLIVEKNPCNIPLICLKNTSKVKNREKYRKGQSSQIHQIHVKSSILKSWNFHHLSVLMRIVNPENFSPLLAQAVLILWSF